MGKKDKALLRASCEALGASVRSEWGPEVTHMATSKELVFTVKTLLAVVAEVPIVHPSWAAAAVASRRPLLSAPLPAARDHALPDETLRAALRPRWHWR